MRFLKHSGIRRAASLRGRSSSRCDSWAPLDRAVLDERTEDRLAAKVAPSSSATITRHPPSLDSPRARRSAERTTDVRAAVVRAFGQPLRTPREPRYRGPMRPCLEPGCPTLTPRTRCPRHERARQAGAQRRPPSPCPLRRRLARRVAAHPRGAALVQRGGLHERRPQRRPPHPDGPVPRAPLAARGAATARRVAWG